MGHLFYIELGNSPGSFTNKGPFTNLQGGFYTSTTAGGANYYYFNFDNGQQSLADINYWYFWIHGLAVHDGKIGSPPVCPGTLGLLLLE